MRESSGSQNAAPVTSNTPTRGGSVARKVWKSGPVTFRLSCRRYHMSRESNRPVRQELMLGLIYPAVLGTLLYQLVFTIAHALREQYPLSAIVWIK